MAQLGAEAKPHSEGCRERIRQAMMNVDVGQQRLYAAEQRVSPAAEGSQEGPDEEMTEALAASSAS